MDDYKNVKMNTVESKWQNVEFSIDLSLEIRYSELDRLSREKDVKIEQLKESYAELERKCDNLTDQCFQLRQQQNEKQREFDHLIREKDSIQSK